MAITALNLITSYNAFCVVDAASIRNLHVGNEE